MLIILHYLTLIIKKTTECIKDSVSAAKKSNNFTKKKKKFCLSLHYSAVNSYLYVNKAAIYQFKVHDNIRWYEFCLGRVSKYFTKNEQIRMVLCMNFCLIIVQLKKKIYDKCGCRCKSPKEQMFRKSYI